MPHAEQPSHHEVGHLETLNSFGLSFLILCCYIALVRYRHKTRWDSCVLACLVLSTQTEKWWFQAFHRGLSLGGCLDCDQSTLT